MKIKKFISWLLIVASAAGICPLTSFAGEYSTELSFEDYIVAHLENFESEIDVSVYAVKNNWDENYIMNEFKRIVIENPQLFFIEMSENFCAVKWVTQRRIKNGIVISSITTYKITDFTYSIKRSEYADMKKSFDSRVKKALSTISDDMADWEKALAIHDYLALNVKYDRSLSKYTAYDALVSGVAVCQGYAMAYVYIMRELGIDCTMITSQSMGHAWNYVKIGGKWYHVDITKNDPLFEGKHDLLGTVNHDYFMLSDAAIKKLGSTGWDTDGLPAASSTKYDNYFWKNAETGLFKLDNSWYWIEMDTTSPAHNQNYKKLSAEEINDNFYKMYSLIKRYNVNTNKTSQVYKFDSTWFVWGTESKSQKSWSDAVYARLAVYDGKLYFNTAKEIYSFDPSTKAASKVAAPSDLNGYIYGMVMNGNKITYTVKQKANQNDSFKIKTIK